MIFDKMQNLGAREKMLMGAAAVAMLLLLMEYGVRVPASVTCADLQMRIENTDRELEVNRSYLRKKKEVRNEYNAIRGLLAKATLATEDIDAFKGEIDELLSRTQLTYNTMSHQEPHLMAGSEFCDEYLVDISRFETQMSKLLVFLHELRKTPGMLRIKKMTIKPVKGTDKITGSMIISKVMISDIKDQSGGGEDVSREAEE